tara:strand:- start:2530 stop:3120 length:591 start_codon:yes stop_codon:yes gene_type:complete
MVLDSLLAGVMLFTSFAARTPNVQPNPDDYEVSIGFSNDYYYVNRQWERELGEHYIDDLFWAKFDNGMYFKPEYMDKQSQGVKYLKLDWRRSWKGFTAGFTTRSTTDKLNEYETFLSGGMSKKRTYWEKVDFEINYNLYLNPNENNDLEPEDYEFENKFKVSWKLTEKIRLYNLGEIARLKGSDYYKAKIGIEVSL